MDRYVRMVERFGEAARIDAGRATTGVFTGAHVINPASGADLPVWVADYVMQLRCWGHLCHATSCGAALCPPAINGMVMSSRCRSASISLAGRGRLRK